MTMCASGTSEESVVIHHVIPCDDWFALCDWDDWDEYQEAPIVAFANYTSTYSEDGEIHNYSGIGPILFNYSEGEMGVVTANAVYLNGIKFIYKGKGNHGLDSILKPQPENLTI